MCCDV
jgi:hypothetical protein